MQTDSRGVPVEHLGDGAYVADMGNGIELRANDHEHPTDRIWLDNYAVGALARFRERVREWQERREA